MSDIVPMNAISLSAALRVLDAVLAEAAALDIPCCVAITDPSGEPVVTARMDHAPRLSAQIALNKAWTVSSFRGMPTHQWWPAIAEEPALVHGITQTPRLTIFGGGVGLLVDDALVGAIGVSGGSADEDRSLAEVGVEALSRRS